MSTSVRMKLIASIAQLPVLHSCIQRGETMLAVMLTGTIVAMLALAVLQALSARRSP